MDSCQSTLSTRNRQSMVRQFVLSKVETIVRELVVEKKTNESALQKLLQKKNAQKQSKTNTIEEEQSTKGEEGSFQVFFKLEIRVQNQWNIEYPIHLPSSHNFSKH